MRPSTKLLLTLLATLSFTVASGCNPIAAALPSLFLQETKVPAGRVAELREPAKIKVWVRDDKGQMKRSYVRAWPGWIIGPSGPTQ
jgi:hypothetical protein